MSGIDEKIFLTNWQICQKLANMYVYVCMYVCTYVRTYVCMYVCIYIYVCCPLLLRQYNFRTSHSRVSHSGREKNWPRILAVSTADNFYAPLVQNDGAVRKDAFLRGIQMFQNASSPTDGLRFHVWGVMLRIIIYYLDVPGS